MSENSDSLLKVVNASGFLFQLRVEHEIQESHDKGKHDWQVVGREHRWVDQKSGVEGFIDLVLKRGHSGIAAECKRVTNADWVFLIEKRWELDTDKARLLWADRSGDFKIANWHTFVVTPLSEQSAFCVVRGQGEKDTPMLERLCGIVLRSLEALALEELQLPPAHVHENFKVYIPLIITTAKLQICHLDPKEVDLETGTLPLDKARFETVPFVRFRKGLATSLAPAELPCDWREANRQNERTVFVVSSGEVSRFLGGFRLVKSAESDMWPWDIYRGRMRL